MSVMDLPRNMNIGKTCEKNLLKRVNEGTLTRFRQMERWMRKDSKKE